MILWRRGTVTTFHLSKEPKKKGNPHFILAMNSDDIAIISLQFIEDKLSMQ